MPKLNKISTLINKDDLTYLQSNYDKQEIQRQYPQALSQSIKKNSENCFNFLINGSIPNQWDIRNAIRSSNPHYFNELIKLDSVPIDHEVFFDMLNKKYFSKEIFIKLLKHPNFDKTLFTKATTWDAYVDLNDNNRHQSKGMYHFEMTINIYEIMENLKIPYSQITRMSKCLIY